MESITDKISTLALATAVAGVSLTSFAQVDLGNWQTGWRTGLYQRGFEDRFTDGIATRDHAAALWAALRWEVFDETAEGAIKGRDGWLFTREEFIEPAPSRDLDAELRRVAQTLRGHGIDLIPVIVPDKARMQADRLPRSRSEGFALRLDRALGSVAAAGLPVIDLRPALSIRDGYMRTDTHWSPRGARASALAIAAALQDRALPRAAVTTTVTGVVPFEGDLTVFADTGPWRPWIGPAPEVIETFETRVDAAEDLFGEAVLPVALVGTSFSAKPAFHFEGFLKDALQADVLNASRIGLGPFVPMDDFLADIGDLASLPTLVIWEIPERYLTSRSLTQ
ncbi:putative alginate biosynthesis protein algJ [Dinoroseobacter shibae DFL 12 = DSM 16493]|jgi:alginate O-acetyltransferase complex protein AlgJ|uniref:Putative alginate biosynthesis protein algJ n=1 Tax=Dinoroseobacter shibae (strain DSM 16493 / NCIMB 14021 / DFL 12) TaxID=398580 RepID=A8LND2_DINSH|nr:alginate biosynthesis protein algJ [Dinoroseobacter shibae]ABV93645.1 putative alginate biosynthesis protein algJ [Dinoroseobacter shibae DFL 12 = DSM 16493]URF45095.1 hypothetical protein M8008_09845 [Dinoroseobacter shibae]URF49400.1 hypothetical protein M8007_09845 [Dinoroseobacter shibae]